MARSDPPRPNPDGAADPYRELFERSADAILIIEDDIFVDCNDAAVQMLRCENRAQVLSTHPSQLSPSHQPDGRDSYSKANEMIAIAFARGSHRFEWDHRRADGKVFPVEVLLTAISEENRRVLHVVWRDITDRKRLEEELRHSQKLEAIGKLAGGIAHDFNNLLVGIIGHGSLLKGILRERGTDAAGILHAEQILSAGERAAVLVRKLLTFARKQKLSSSVLDMNGLVLDLRELLERLVGDTISLEIQTADEILAVRGDRSQLEQVLLNLASNGRDAMPSGGTLTIALRLLAETSQGEKPQSFVELVVRDTGVGMEPDTKERAFDPFFTTKEMGKGTGLGLSTVHGIVEQAGGRVRIDSESGHGTSVTVLYPRSDEELTPEARVVGLPAPRGDETILVVEDEEVVGDLAKRVLEDHGYTVLRVGSGREALELFQAETVPQVDAMVVDVMMPGMSGPDLVAHLRGMGQRPRVLFMSGYTDDTVAGLLPADHKVGLLEKPFAPLEVVRRVRAMLDAATEEGSP